MRAIPKKVFLVVIVIAAWRIGFAATPDPWRGALFPGVPQGAAPERNESPQ